MARHRSQDERMPIDIATKWRSIALAAVVLAWSANMPADAQEVAYDSVLTVLGIDGGTHDIDSYARPPKRIRPPKSPKPQPPAPQPPPAEPRMPSVWDYDTWLNRCNPRKDCSFITGGDCNLYCKANPACQSVTICNDSVQKAGTCSCPRTLPPTTQPRKRPHPQASIALEL